MTLKQEVKIVDDGEDFDPFAGGEIGRTAPITPEQHELWLSVQLGGSPANLAYNLALEFSLGGPLDSDLLARCLDELVLRHEALRITLSGDGAQLCIAPTGKMALIEKDLSGLGAEERERELALARSAAVDDEFDLVKGPLVRCTLLRLAEQQHALILVAHHVICDGSSLSTLTSELAELYSAKKRGKPPNLPPATPFSSYATTRAAEAGSEQAENDLQYWRERYKTLPPQLELPLDRQRPPERSYGGDRVDVTLPPGLARDLKATAARHGTSLATLLFASLQAFLLRITGQRSFSLILPGAGQTISGQKALVGHCVRTLPMRAEVDPKQPFHEHLLAVRTAMLDALDHPRITFGELVKALPLPRDPSRIPLAAVAFNFDANAAPPAFEGLETGLRSLPRNYESFEWFVSFAVSGDEIVIEACFSTELFEKSSMQERMTEFVALLADVAQSSGKRVGELAVMTEQQRLAVLAGNNRTDAELPTRTLCAKFRELARRSPERVAVASPGRSLTYAELDRQSAALAHELKQLGAGAGSFVGVFLKRSVDLLVATLGVMRAGAAYVPLDPDYPSDRLSFISADTKLSLVVTESELAPRLPAGARGVLVDQARASASTELDDSQLSGAAYVIYTSGSTGKPKGALIEHRNVANVLAAFAKRPGLSESDAMICVASLCFDMSVPDLFLPITIGARVVIASEDEIVEGQRLARLLQEQGAALMQATPAGWRVLLESGWQGQATLRAVCAGEALPSDLASELGKRVPVLWNGYGPTECTVYTTFDRVDAPPATIGTPIDNVRVYVLDSSLNPVAAGVVGELYVGGAGVGRGYHQRPELDSERFVRDPFASAEGARMYKTGDLGRWRRDGRLEWLGRNDFQVKVRGFRIELGEIEAQLGETPGVREGVVVVREDRPGDQRIVAYVRPKAGVELGESSIREELKKKLPAYMVPQHVVVVSQFPLTPSGKIDRRALPAPESASQARAPETELEQRVADEFAELLGMTKIGIDDDFFAFGGHSLLALRLAARLRALSGVDLPVRVVFQSATVKSLSDYIEAALAVRRGSGVWASAGSSDREEHLL